jgi:branched-subunit amino acid ABC-type transport system permease component
MGAAAATGTFTGSVWTLLWPIGLAVAAIGGLVLVIKHLVEEYNKDADAAKEATKQTEKL